jgi:hypothetical protein
VADAILPLEEIGPFIYGLWVQRRKPEGTTA